ncbi:hypothetical protein [Acidiphilium acidophilum]|uniref:hypothetical protein n=1 Tax=Acidiphilium acidophilum TaxID=76588 RepID=UPI002E8E65E5|nr:hypothetical protein [Acidiphilium acidophilum]
MWVGATGMIFHEEIPERYVTLWQRIGGDRYLRNDGSEIVHDREDGGWRAMVPVFSDAGRTSVWHGLIIGGRNEIFPNIAAAMDSVEAYLAMSSWAQRSKGLPRL